MTLLRRRRRPGVSFCASYSGIVTEKPGFSLRQLIGAACALGGALWIAMLVGTSLQPQHSHRGPSGALLFPAMVLIIGGVVGVHFHQRRQAGRIGKAAAAFAAAGIIFTVLARLGVDLIGVSPRVFFVGLLCFVGGIVLFAVSIIRAGVLPRGSGWLLLVGTMLIPLFNFGDNRVWLGAPFGLAWIWIGWGLVTASET